MQSSVLQAIEVWEQRWEETQSAATAALMTAFPHLRAAQRYIGCDELRLEYADESRGGGRVCVDNEGRANVEFDRIPNTVIARAVDECQFPYLDDAEGPLRGAPPGTYVYECETYAAQYEFTLGPRGLGKVVISFAPIPDTVGVLDALARAFDENAT